MQIEFPEDLNCPICMSVMKIPITTECGHSFCRSCLVNSAKDKKSCPMCRQQFQNSPDKLKQDEILSNILDQLRIYTLHSKKKEDTSFESKSQTMLLLDVKTQKLLLPYNKIPVSFELQNPVILNKLEKFVARQESPFNKYGVISRIVSLNKLRYNVYQCILQGKAFCLIEEDTVEQGMSEMDEEYFYRTCKAKQIIETSNTNPKQFNLFLSLFRQIKDSQILQKVYRRVDHKIFLHANDPLAMTYSILGILDREDSQKYEVVTKFDEESRIQFIKNAVSKVNHDVSFNVRGFLNIDSDRRSNYGLWVSFGILLVLIYLINKDSTGQL